LLSKGSGFRREARTATFEECFDALFDLS